MDASSDDEGIEAVVHARMARARELLCTVDHELTALARERAVGVADDEHDPEGVPLSGEWSRLRGLQEEATRELADLEEALRRIAAGTYGRCRCCGRMIPVERLRIRPEATRCVPCAEAGAC